MPNQITQALEALKNCKTALLSVDGLRFGWEISQAEEAIAALSSAAPSAAEPVAIPEGWKLVPVEPTAEMIAAWPNGHHGSGHEAPIYRAMLSAAPPAPQAASEPVADNWRQYATERENTAQQVVERHRQEHDSLLRLLANARKEQEHAYRCIQGMYHALTTETLFNQGYHAPTIGAAKRFVFEGALDGSEYFIGKPVDVLHAALALPEKGK